MYLTFLCFQKFVQSYLGVGGVWDSRFAKIFLDTTHFSWCLTRWCFFFTSTWGMIQFDEYFSDGPPTRQLVVWGPVVWIALWKELLLCGARFESQNTRPQTINLHQLTIWLTIICPVAIHSKCRIFLVEEGGIAGSTVRFAWILDTSNWRWQLPPSLRGLWLLCDVHEFLCLRAKGKMRRAQSRWCVESWWCRYRW